MRSIVYTSQTMVGQQCLDIVISTKMRIDGLHMHGCCSVCSSVYIIIDRRMVIPTTLHGKIHRHLIGFKSWFNKEQSGRVQNTDIQLDLPC